MEIKLKAGDTLQVPDGCKAVVEGNEVVIEAIQEFKDGDVIISVDTEKYEPFYIIMVRGDFDDVNDLYAYAVMDSDGKIKRNVSSDRPYYANYRLATADEKQLLFDRMTEEGLRWNAEEKRVEKIMWEPKVGETYYRLGRNLIVFEDRNDDMEIDRSTIKAYNCFNTEELCEGAAPVVAEALRKYKEENE